MPAQEEVDEINEFLQKRREKQRLGELPRNDFTPGFAKKISLAVFGKPRVEKVPLQSTQPTVASTQAQAAMRLQLDEIMDTHLSTAARSTPAAPLKSAYSPTPKSAFASPTSSPSPARAPTPSATTSASPAAPRVPHYYSNMPYPPYIQRGLASLPKPSPTAAQAAALPRTTSTTPAVPSIAPRTNAWPTPAARAPPVTSIPQSAAKPSAPTPLPASSTAPSSSAMSSAPRVTPILPPGERKIPSARTTAPTISAMQRPSIPITSAATNAPASSTPKQSFWKKIFGGKQTPAAPSTPASMPTAVSNMAKPIAPSPYATPYSSAARTTATPAARIIEPIAPIAPIPRTVSTIPQPSEKSADISPVTTKQTPPSIARVDIATIAREKTNVPALTPPTPAIISGNKPYTPAPSPAPTARESNETKKEFTTPINSAPQTQPKSFVSTPSEKIFAPAQPVRAQPSAPLASAPSPVPVASPAEKSAPYVPPWVARTATPVQSPSSSVSETMPWKQPFGTHADEASPNSRSREKNIPIIENDTPSYSHEKKSLDKEEDELKVEDADAYSTPAAPAHSPGMESAMEQEISEEEALESLPFEDVEGLSASDLDYLSQKEKEHRKAQEEKDNDLGIPSELKDTLQRQSTQLEGALTPTPQTTKTPTNDEKQDILRRLKQMMEEDGHPQ